MHLIFMLYLKKFFAHDAQALAPSRKLFRPSLMKLLVELHSDIRIFFCLSL